MANYSKSGASETNKGFEPAEGFLNVSIPARDGRVAKLGAIALKRSDTVHAKILDLLKERGVEVLDGKLILTFQLANSRDDLEFDL